MLYTRIYRKSRVNSLTANARFVRNIGTRFSVFSWMDFSSIHITTCSITICAKLLFSINMFHCKKLFMCPNRIKSDLYINGGGGCSVRRGGADQIGSSIVNTLSWLKVRITMWHWICWTKRNFSSLIYFFNINQFSLRTKLFYHLSFWIIYFSSRWRKLHEYLKMKLDFRVRKMTRAASQAWDDESSRTPGLNTSVQTSMNDHGVRYYIVFMPH